ncbi:MBL fold metallo-hydrolase [Candidatus Gracilibacteria bacterium]|nr:MBL fold metallo-hydrolase [Candidatus Gracilibacteria bacterium]
MIKQIAINGYDSNFSYFVGDGEKMMVVDPGDNERLFAVAEEEGYEIVGVLITHSHHDHVEGVDGFVEKFGCAVFAHENAVGRVSKAVALGEEVEIGGMKLEVLWTPGHIDDAVCFYCEEEEFVITGDTVFVEGCGRADLQGSNVEDLYESVERIKELPDAVKIYAGHDYGSKAVSDLAWEKAHNRFFLCESLEEFVEERMG